MSNAQTKLGFPVHRLPMNSLEIIEYFKVDVTPANRARTVRNMAKANGWPIVLLSTGQWVLWK